MDCLLNNGLMCPNNRVWQKSEFYIVLIKFWEISWWNEDWDLLHQCRMHAVESLQHSACSICRWVAGLRCLQQCRRDALSSGACSGCCTSLDIGLTAVSAACRPLLQCCRLQFPGINIVNGSDDWDWERGLCCREWRGHRDEEVWRN